MCHMVSVSVNKKIKSKQTYHTFWNDPEWLVLIITQENVGEVTTKPILKQKEWGTTG